MDNQQDKEWGLALAWNKALEEVDERPMKVRDNLWASELGKSPIDLYLKMKATPLTNPPNARSLRKFEAGNVFEWIVSLILKRAGILQEQQKWVSHQYPNLLQVTGKADFIAGGEAQKNTAIESISCLGLPSVFIKGGEQILTYLQQLGRLEEMPIEVKSISSFMYEALDRTKRPMAIHVHQLTHYMKAMNYPRGRVVYICRDDLRMAEFPVSLAYSEAGYKKAIEEISHYVLNDERPPLEKPIVFDPDIGKFAKNFNVAYSGYLTMLYGFKDQKEFDDLHTPKVARWNRVMARIKNNDKITVKNEEVIAEIKEAGFDIDECVAQMPETITIEEEID